MAKRRFMAMLAAATLAAAGAAVLVPATTAGATDVGDETAFRAAFLTDTQIDLTADIVLTCVDGGQASRNAAGGAVTVNGHGFTIQQTCVDDDSVLFIQGPDALTLVNVTITGGFTDHGGAGVHSDGTGDLTFIDSTVTGNSVCDGGEGAGVVSHAGADIFVVRSTFTDNHADGEGGAIAVTGETGDISILNSTITGNSSGQLGGAVFANNDATVAYSTIVGNSIGSVPCGTSGDALDAPVEGHHDAAAPEVSPQQIQSANLSVDGDVEIFGTVIAQPIGAPNCDTFSATSDGYNWSDDDPSAGQTCGFTGTGDTQSNGGSPALGALAANGGPTQTLLPQTGSPLLDAIPLAACQTAPLATGVTIDQRNLPRPGISTPGCDIGAVEVQGLAIVPRFTG